MNRNNIASEQYVSSAWKYSPGPRFHDELLTPEGEVRPQWQILSDSLLSIGPEDLSRRWQEGRRLIHDNGVTYNVYGDPQTTDRPWPVDPIPLPLDAREWASIETAITQRATLLNAILADVYGPQKLLRKQLLPAELVYPNPFFLRPCCDVPVPGSVHLHVYSADLARSPNGQWWVIADRTQAPSGAGYALENRLVSSRVLPDVFRAANVRRLANFFQTYKETLRRLVRRNSENPRIVLLTPGPYNETYFEHAFLARYLGYTLVEGGDLTVRDNSVFLKTLGGLLPVDVIVRRQDDNFCDPLELRGDSMLGVPGLMQAIRSGNVAVANALGSGLMESPATAAFLPGLCRHILGEDLKMPTVATWWCGEKGPRTYAEEHLSELVIKAAFPAPGAHPIFGSRLDAKERAALLEKIRARPGKFAAQEQVALSTVPVWENGKLEPRHVILRVYAVSTGSGYSVMPGGLTRVSSSLDSLIVSMQRGGGSKDTWVIAEGPTPQFSLLRSSTTSIEVSRATFDLPSRVADNLFWLGRYVERIEPAVRISRAVLRRLSQEPDPNSSSGLLAGSKILASLGHIKPELPQPTESRASFLEREILSMIYDSGARGSMGWTIHRIRSVAWLLRDRISADAWRILNRFDQQFSETPPPGPLLLSGAQDLLDHAVITISAFGGLVMDGMTRGHGWRFLEIGRRLERALQMAELVRCGMGIGPVVESGQLEAMLEMADSALTYRSRYLTSMQANLVLDLLLVDEANPRSLAFQLARLREHIDELPESQAYVRRPAEARLALSMLTAVQLVDVEELAKPNSEGKWVNLDQFIARLQADLRLLSETLTRGYFDHVLPSRQLSAP